MASVYWQDYLSLKKALLHMFDNRISCDVIFDIGSDQIPCHSFVLIARSHVFEANLDSPLVKLSSDGVNSTKKIELNEVVDTDGVKEFLKYLYTDDIDLGEDNVMTLLYLAQSLDDPTNAVELYHQAFLLDITDVMEDSMKVINQSTKRCLESVAFLTLPPQCVRGLIADNHHQLDEDNIYRYVVQWYICIQMTLTYVMTLVYLPRKYMVCSLSEKCHSFITAASLDDPTNAVELYHQAFLLDITEVMEDSMKVINQSTKRCLESEALLTLPPQCVRGLIADNHHQLDEDNIYRYVVQWCERRCERGAIENTDENYRKVLGDILYEIRFPNISYKFFKSSIERRNILTEIENKDLINKYRNENRCTYRGIFKSEPRNKAVEIQTDIKFVVSLELDDANWMWNSKHGIRSVYFNNSEIQFTDEPGTEETNTFQGQIPGIILS
ncbi:unnamed protein product [Mytilus coruscus]|uniref:BTB domain-containing protein n=1 Tax=Mytilus coruscus TaxID=42192 RepID=A0A6J8CJ52_MYTCO|nr:unnamed protein product [Mytilus coruscus]